MGRLGQIQQMVKGQPVERLLLHVVRFYRALTDVQLQDLVFKSKEAQPWCQAWYQGGLDLPADSNISRHGPGVRMWHMFPFLQRHNRQHELWEQFSKALHVREAELELQHKPPLSDEEIRAFTEALAQGEKPAMHESTVQAQKRLLEAKLETEQAKSARHAAAMEPEPVSMQVWVERMEGMPNAGALLLPNLGTNT